MVEGSRETKQAVDLEGSLDLKGTDLKLRLEDIQVGLVFVTTVVNKVAAGYFAVVVSVAVTRLADFHSCLS